MSGRIKDLPARVRLDLHNLRIGYAAFLIDRKAPRSGASQGKRLQEGSGGCRKLTVGRTVHDEHAAPVQFADPTRDLAVGVAPIKLPRPNPAVAEDVEIVLQSPVENFDLAAGILLLEIIGERKDGIGPLARSAGLGDASYGGHLPVNRQTEIKDGESGS